MVLFMARGGCVLVVGGGEYLGKFAYIFLCMHAAMPIGRNMHACTGPPFTSLGSTRTPTIYCDASQLFNVPASGTVCEVYIYICMHLGT